MITFCFTCQSITIYLLNQHLVSLIIIIIKMRVYHYDIKKQLSFQELPEKLTNFEFYYKGRQITIRTKQELLSKLQTLSDAFIVLKNKKTKGNMKKQVDMEGLIHNLSKQEQFNASQIELFKQHPKSLFEKRLYTFKYTSVDSETKGIPKEREEQLKKELKTGVSNWKEASLQQLQQITSKYDQILDDLCQTL